MLFIFMLVYSVGNYAHSSDLGKIGFWECSINVFGNSYYGKGLSEKSARNEAATKCNSNEQDTFFCSAIRASCEKTFGFKGQLSLSDLENNVLITSNTTALSCETYEAYCDGIGNSSGYGSTIVEAKANMPVKCIPVKVRCVD